MLHRETVIVEDFTSPAEHTEYLYHETRGYKEIGSGAYATAYYSEERPDEVIKVVCASDYGYMGWLEVIQELGDNNPYLPRIYEVTQYKWADTSEHYRWASGHNEHIGFTCDDRFVVRMEKLTRIKHTQKGISRYAIRYGWTIEDAIRPYSTVRNNMTNKRRLEAVLLLEIAQEQTRACADLHHGNYMMRKGGQVVFTDPFS